MHKCLRLLVAGLLLLPSIALAESSPEAAEWLRKVAGLYQKGPVTADFEMQLSPAPTMPVSGQASGSLIQRDDRHTRVEMTMEMGGGGGQGGMKVSLLSVNDGTTLWNEIDMGMGKQVTKLALADAEKMAQQNPLGIGMGSGGMDPVAQVAQLSKLLDFELADAAGDAVTLRARFTPEALKAMSGSATMPGFETVTLVLDKSHAFPRLIEIGGEQPFITVRFDNVKFVSASELPAGAFDYAPPEGVPVIDAAAMLQRQGGG